MNWIIDLPNLTSIEPVDNVPARRDDDSSYSLEMEGDIDLNELNNRSSWSIGS